MKWIEVYCSFGWWKYNLSKFLLSFGYDHNALFLFFALGKIIHNGLKFSLKFHIVLLIKYVVNIIDFRRILNPLCFVLVDTLGKTCDGIQSHLSHHVETTALCPKSWVLGIGTKFCFSLFSFFWPFLAFWAKAISRIFSSLIACLSFSWKVIIVNV